MPQRPEGHSRWTHREKGGDYTALTVAKGTGPDHGVEFVYYLGLDTTTGALQAFVRRLDDWDRAMVPHPTLESVYERTMRELEGQDDQDKGPWYFHHPESDSVWIEDTQEGRKEALADGLVHEISADRYEELTGLYSTDPFEDYGLDDFDLDL